MAHHWQCCFCGQTIVEAKEEKISFVVTYGDGGQQALMAHMQCFRQKLHREVPTPFESEGNPA